MKKNIALIIDASIFPFDTSLLAYNSILNLCKYVLFDYMDIHISGVIVRYITCKKLVKNYKYNNIYM